VNRPTGFVLPFIILLAVPMAVLGALTFAILDAAIEAAELRSRPILMTSFAFILGALPLYFASGAGKLGHHSVGTAVVGGMLFSTSSIWFSSLCST
jgi:multidrug efflux pump subunit AcrB